MNRGKKQCLKYAEIQESELVSHISKKDDLFLVHSRLTKLETGLFLTIGLSDIPDWLNVSLCVKI